MTIYIEPWLNTILLSVLQIHMYLKENLKEYNVICTHKRLINKALTALILNDMSLHHEVTVILKHQNIISMFCIWIGFKNNFSLIQCLPFEKKI